MANGRGSSELGNSVFRCGVRTGLKREFVFALKAQAQLPLSLGRTRSRKSSAATVGAPLVNQSKRRKKSGTDMTPEAAEPQLVNVPLMILSPSPSDLVDAGSPDVVDGKDEAMVAVVPLDNGSSVETLMVMDGRNKSVLDGPPTVKPLKVFVTSLSGGIAEGTVNSHPLPVEPAELRGKANDTANSPAHLDEFAESEIAGQIVVDDNGMSKLNENGCVEYPVVIDGNDGLEVDSSETENQANKTIVSATDYASGEPPIMMPLSIMKMDETGSPVEMSAVIHCLNGRTMESDSSNKTCNRRFTRSTLTLPAKEQKGSSVDHPVTINGHYSTKNNNSHLGMPLRRLTRSAVKAKLESSSGDITSTSSYSSGSEDINHGADTVDSSSVLIPKSKMELKMSKKITLTKLPNNVRELLSTGLLEGLPVNYIASNSNVSGSFGVLKTGSVADPTTSSSKNLSSNKKNSLGRLTRKLILTLGTLNDRLVLHNLKLMLVKHQGANRKFMITSYNYIYTSNGVSLHELSVSLSKCRKMSTSESDDLCSICADGGDLLLCDLCPRAFHKGIFLACKRKVGFWKLLKLQRAGRVAGVDPIEQIYKRCIRIFFHLQCEREYHVGCLRDHKMADLKELPAGEWFCCTDCSRIRRELLVFLHHGADSLPFSDANVIKKKRDSRGLNEEVDADIRWRLLMILQSIKTLTSCFAVGEVPKRCSRNGLPWDIDAPQTSFMCRGFLTSFLKQRIQILFE
ncbi:hypothetical protein B296_00014479 [Ensete ventricosum]|uniref:Zinc finger PHD-type domain-containing protein n=1 Tax=Ensete ventricosum TaxID=4639 RepID=A0A427B7M3_ENSVE|nr:hypothetical protein B296_00014479 [Ensete ventricosum]